MRILTSMHAALRARFARLNLQGKITAALLAVLMLSGTLVASASFFLARQQMIDSTQSLLQARAQLERREIELKLGALLAEAAALAGNTVTANSLADSLGREIYLQPLLQNYKLSLPGATLALTNHRGEAIAKSEPGAALGAGAKRAFEGMMESGTAFASIEASTQDQHLISVAFPVIYRLTGSIEGAVLLQFAPAALELSDGQQDWAMYDSAGRLLAGSPPPAAALQVRAALNLPRSIWSLGLEHTLSIDSNLALKSLDYLLAAYFGVALLLVIGALKFSRATAAFLSAPMRELTVAVEEMAASGRPSAWIALGDEDEFNRLARAFNSMVDRLGESYAELESRVASRTREMESARVAAENAGKLLQAAVSKVAQGFTIFDAQDRLVMCNEAYRNLYGIGRDIIVPGATFEDILRSGIERGQYQEQEAIGAPEAWVRHRLAQHQAANGEVIEQKLVDGRWLLVVEYRLASGHIVGNRIDVTELKQATEHLRERTEQLNAVFDLSPDGFVSFDTAHCVKYASPAFTDLTGLQQEAVIGLDEPSFSNMLAAKCLFEAAFRGVTALRELRPAASERREIIELAGPSARVLEVGLRESQTTSVSQILYFRDVTREIEIERLKSEFLSTAAHELRTPMASIYGFSELLLKEEFDAATQRDLIDTIHRNADLMASIINELLDLSRIEARRGKDFIFQTIEAQELVRRAAANYNPPEGREAPLLDLPAHPLWLRADPKKMEQALSNVISNAYKYSPDGGTVRLDLTVQDKDGNAGEIGLRVTDRGIGMKPEQVARVCERFYRADSSGRIPGTGLGMSIVSEILNLHGGRVAIASAPGAGTEVTLWTPAANAAAGAA